MSAATKTASLDTTIETFFQKKTASDVAGNVAFFAPDLVSYIDATLGWQFDGYDALKGVFEQYMPNWSPPARSYATGVLANDTSALVRTTNTPELFGGELRILAALDFAESKIVRWVDYRDSSSFDNALYTSRRTPGDSFPTDLKDNQVATQAAPELVAAATALQDAFRQPTRQRQAETHAHRHPPRGHVTTPAGNRPGRGDRLPPPNPRRRSVRVVPAGSATSSAVVTAAVLSGPRVQAPTRSPASRRSNSTPSD